MSILVLPDALGASVFAAHDDLHAIGRRPDLCERTGPVARRFDVRLVGLESGPVPLAGGVSVHAQHGIGAAPASDLVFVPALLLAPDALDPETPTPFGAAVRTFLRERYAAGATLVSLCTGVAPLADAGLLEGAPAACYAAMADAFRRRFPGVAFDPERPMLVTGDGERLVMAGEGVYHSDLLLYLIQRFIGREVMHAFAQLSGKFWVGDARNVHARLVERQEHRDGLVLAAQRWLSEHLDTVDPVERMASRSGVSRRTFARRFREATRLTPVRYVQALRVERARGLLERGRLPVSEIAARVGYADVSHFSRVFRRETGLAPGAYRRRFRLPPEPPSDLATASGSACI